MNWGDTKVPEIEWTCVTMAASLVLGLALWGPALWLLWPNMASILP